MNRRKILAIITSAALTAGNLSVPHVQASVRPNDIWQSGIDVSDSDISDNGDTKPTPPVSEEGDGSGESADNGEVVPTPPVPEEGDGSGENADNDGNIIEQNSPFAVEDPDQYYNIWWDFEDKIWDETSIGTQIIAEGGNVGASLSLAEEEGTANHYMNITGNKGGSYRVSRLDINSGDIAGAEVVFDWKPISIESTSSRFGDIAFYTTDNTYPYFGLQFDNQMNLMYYTIGENVEKGWGINYPDSETEEGGLPVLEGGFRRNKDAADGTAAVTGVQGDGATWYSVHIYFNYIGHTADLAIAERDSGTILYQEAGIPIYDYAADLMMMSAGGWKAIATMGVDNLGIRYDTEIPKEVYYTTYWNDFEEAIWQNTPIGDDIVAEGGTSTAALSHRQEASSENHYMDITGDKNGSYRVSKLKLSDEAAASAEVTFDWMPVMANDNTSRFGEIAFYTAGNTYAYFGLQFDKDLRIKYYTIGENIEKGWGCSYPDMADAGTGEGGGLPTLEGGYRRENGGAYTDTAKDTGIQADGATWYTVNLVFDYEKSVANLSIVKRDEPDIVLYSEENIPIYSYAAGLASISAGGWKAIIEMGLDNLGVRSSYSQADTIVSVVQPKSAMVMAAELEEHFAGRPSVANVTMGDGSVRELPIGEWVSEPAFDENTFGKYKWTAQFILPEGTRNPKNLALTYEMNYVKNYMIMGAYDVNTLEAEFGTISSVEEFEEIRGSRKAQAVLSNGELVMVELDHSSWTAVNNKLPSSFEPDEENHPTPEVPTEFDPEKEGIYIYKVKLIEDGEYPLEEDGEVWVEWRVNYFSYDNHFNGYERAIEQLDRGLYAINNVVFDAESGTYTDSSQGGIYLSWRILVDEYEKVSAGTDIAFEVYRNDEKVTTLTNQTNYLDLGGKAGDVYVVKGIQGGIYTYSKEVAALEENYISIPLQRPLPSYGATDRPAIYRLNDTEVADVDGDNEYELIVKWYPNNGFDPGISGTAPSSPHIIDVYEMDGTALWRLYMGYSSPASQHFDNYMVYDLDGDGRAELSILTHDGTRTYRPDENGKFVYRTTTQGGYVFQPDNPADSESAGHYVLSADGEGYLLSNGAEFRFPYVSEYGSPMMDDKYLVSEIGDRSKEGIGIEDSGHLGVDAEEYFTVFDGETGKVIDTVDYYYSTSYFMNETANKDKHTVHRFNMGIATIPTDIQKEDCTTTIPAVMCNRSYYADISMIAYTLVNGKIVEAWKTYIPTASQGGGNHNLVTGDVDNDGFDEVYMGGTCIDHDGSVLWAKDGFDNMDFMKHGDMIHMTAVYPDSNQLYVFTPVEDSSVSLILNYALSNGATGARVVGHTFGKGDTGRGMLANVTPGAGYELWASNPSSDAAGRYTSALYNVYGDVVSTKRPAVQTWASYWDGDLLSELPDSNPSGGGDKSGRPMGVHKYNWETGVTETIASFAGTLTSNSSKNNPNLIADIMGDWREEILVRASNNEELRIYMTNIPTEYTIYSLMQDPVYRNSVATQNNCYNQPSHTSFYLGEDEQGRNRVLNFELPVYSYRYTTELPRYTDVTFVSNETETAVDTDILLGSTILEPQDFVKEGYRLEGWYQDKALTLPWNFETDKIAGPMNLYAKWVKDNEPVQPTQSPDVPEEPTQSPDIPGEPTQSPDTPGEPTQSPDVPEEPTQSPDTPGEPTQSPDVPEEPTQSPDASEEPTTTPDSSGDVIVDQVTDGKAPETTVLTGQDELKEILKDSVLTKEEKALVDSGADCEVSIHIKDINAIVSADIKQQVEKKALGYTMGMYMDISLSMKLVKNGETIPNSERPVNNLGTAGMELEIKLPAELISDNDTVNREYIIVRVHEGEYDLLYPIFDIEAGTLKFKSDKYSVYAIGYQDVSGTEEEENEQDSDNNQDYDSEDAQEEEKDNAPKTGDDMNHKAMIWIIVLTMAAFGIAVTIKRHRNSNK